MNFCKMLLSKITICEDNFFRDIVGYDHIKRLFRMALDSDSVVHILLVGPPASAKTMFLPSLMHHLKHGRPDLAALVLWLQDEFC
jgi:CBS domain containing-hemolysin-like protein